LKFITIRELARSSSRYLKQAHDKEDLVITRQGLPYAILSGIDGDSLEDYILAKHCKLEQQFDQARLEYDAGETLSADDFLRAIEGEE